MRSMERRGTDKILADEFRYDQVFKRTRGYGNNMNEEKREREGEGRK